MVIKMNELYIFNVKEEFYKLYKNKTSELFYIYNRIYKMKKIDKEYGYNLFCQISNFYDKNEISNFLMNKYKNKMMYSKNGNEHIINNLFLNEISILTVKNSHIKLESSINKPTFIEDLSMLKLYLFICNFKEKNYYFISKKKTKVN